MQLKHAVHLKNISAGGGSAGALIGCSQMTFIIAFYDEHCEEVMKIVDGRVGKWQEQETKESYEKMDRWAGKSRMGDNVDLHLDIYSMLFVTTFHAEYVHDL